LNIDGSQAEVALNREDKVETTLNQEKNGQDEGVVTGQVQLEHGKVAPSNVDRTNEEFTHGDFKDPAQSRFFEPQKTQQQPELQHQPMTDMEPLEFHPTRQVTAHLEAQQIPNSLSPGKQQIQKEFSAAIRGSYRVQKSNDFVSTRLQQRAG
jgi:hypothetical protein